MYIDDKNHVAYVAVPKVGSYSIHDYFGHSIHPEPTEHHMGVKRLLREYPRCADYNIFGFVRNPWSKVVSTYFDFTLRRIYQYSAKVREDKPLLSEFEDFEAFCHELKDSPRWSQDIFFVPQSELLIKEDDNPVDFIGRFENLQEDFNVICDRFGLPRQNLNFRNKGMYRKDYREYYTNSSRQAISDFYKKDVERFGYEF